MLRLEDSKDGASLRPIGTPVLDIHAHPIIHRRHSIQGVRKDCHLAVGNRPHRG